ncbi:phosphatase PAP2 family protein [Butyrivibrio sp. JL13D10]|uniref:phosphatase PAP2 family protein n=1 Tax=Butyrivibrio sp. JL13D10 TaxID=3236815 RepID=UPI0038B4C089
MKRKGFKSLLFGALYLIVFVVWTLLIQIVDVQPVGQNGTDIGFATINCYFHKLTGVHMVIYTITDWLGLVPIFICLIFAGIGLTQLIQRKSLFRVDYDIIVLGIYYIIVIFGYLIFEMIPINYRPVLIDGFMEASYPSSTTLLVLSVMPTLWFQAKRRMKNEVVLKYVCVLSALFSIFMFVGRTVAGVHWLTDIMGSILLSTGLFLLYRAVVLIIDDKAKA